MDGAASEVKLLELFFPVQEVRANAEHDPSKNREGTQLVISLKLSLVDKANARYGALLEVASNSDTSDNPPYFFKLHAYAVFALNETASSAEAEEKLKFTAQNVLMGAARERLLDLTSRAPWGRFMLALHPISWKSE